MKQRPRTLLRRALAALGALGCICGQQELLIYDGDGNRICEIVDGQVKSYLVDDRDPTGYAQVVEEIVNGSVNHTYIYGHDLISQDQMDATTGVWI
jgi:hypothetical protein